jgi:hypothetical protein
VANCRRGWTSKVSLWQKWLSAHTCLRLRQSGGFSGLALDAMTKFMLGRRASLLLGLDRGTLVLATSVYGDYVGISLLSCCSGSLERLGFVKA